MEFFDINLTEDSSLLLHAIHSSFYWRILNKTILYSDFYYSLVNESKKPNKIRVWEDSSLCPETSTKNADQETHLRSRF